MLCDGSRVLMQRQQDTKQYCNNLDRLFCKIHVYSLKSTEQCTQSMCVSWLYSVVQQVPIEHF